MNNESVILFILVLILFFFSVAGSVSQSLKLDEMYSTSVSLKSGVYVNVCVFVCVKE